MLIQETGSSLIGFTQVKQCPHCHNTIPFQVRVTYLKQYIIVVPVSNQTNNVFMLCPVCEQREYLMRNTHFIYKAFKSEEAWNSLHSILDGGKKYTKIWFDKCNSKQKKKY